MSQLALWNGYMQGYDFLTQVDGYRRNMQDVLSRCHARLGAKVLDAGSGTGNLSLLLKEQGAQVVSCDFSRTALEKHRLKDPEAILVEASLGDRLPFEDNSFDSVCCASVLFALSQAGSQQAVREFQRVLRPGGRLVVTVPSAAASLSRLVELYFGGMIRRHGRVAGFLRGLGGLPGLARVLYYNHKLKTLPDWNGFHYFTESELGTLITQAGLNTAALTRTYGSVFLLAVATKPESALVEQPARSAAMNKMLESVQAA